MQPQELERRQERAERDTWVIAETGRGFRIHSPTSGGRPYLVTGISGQPACTCPDFQNHVRDPDWRCKHILAVQARYGSNGHGNGVLTDPEPPLTQDLPTTVAPETQLLVKRSVSPDGRIDSLSVEFACPVDDADPERVKTRARRLLALQEEVVNGFLEVTRPPGGPVRPTIDAPPVFTADGAQPAQLLQIGGTDGKWGRRLFITVQANGKPLRLFGSQKQLAEHLERAGYIAHTGNVREGVHLNLPCRIVTAPSKNGQYIDVVQVLPPLGR